MVCVRVIYFYIMYCYYVVEILIMVFLKLILIKWGIVWFKYIIYFVFIYLFILRGKKLFVEISDVIC